MLEYQRINEKIIDTHMHLEAFENEEFSDFTKCFEKYREITGVSALNICTVPTHQSNVCNNIMLALYKLANESTFIHGGFEHINHPISENVPDGMDLVTQYRELMEIGFDGIKLIEGKPICLKPLGNNLNHPALDRLYSEMEKDGTHIVFHINDPYDCWDREKTTQEFIDKGWFYGDGTYLTFEETYKQALELLEKHPNIKATLAHFFFCADTPERLIQIFRAYPNVCVDITPGCEMYHSFERNHDYYKDFFERFSDRILVGTDGTFPWATKCHSWCINILYEFIATDHKNMAFDDSILTGLNLNGEAKENILYKNYEKRVSESPKPINKDALKKYIEKYKEFITDENWQSLKPALEKYLY